jgi:SAM-dependent methyltransferase
MEKWQLSSPAHAIEEYTFIDFGCGKGRAALLASELGFREVVGVELNPNLAAIAQANVELWIAAGKAKCPIGIACGDALDLEWPEGPCLVYLYNPFGEQVMRRLAEKMKTHFSGRPGDLEVIYQKPEQAALLTEDFEMVWCQTIPMSEDDSQAELVADPKDESRAYRLAKLTHSMNSRI